MLCRIRPPGFIEPCLPSPADKPPRGANWIHEIKHDGFRMMARRDVAGSSRGALIVEALKLLRCG
jgi:ATP-dependent DNA ligase